MATMSIYVCLKYTNDMFINIHYASTGSFNKYKYIEILKYQTNSFYSQPLLLNCTAWSIEKLCKIIQWSTKKGKKTTVI